MNWKPHLPEIFLLISLGMIAIEAALSGVAPIKARQGLTSKNIRIGWEARHGG
jgi:hypothetical protein